MICAVLDKPHPRKDGVPYADLIAFVKDRPTHDRRNAIDARKIEPELGWKRMETFETGIRKTVRWYLDNQGWIDGVTSGAYRPWLSTNHGK